MSLLQHLFWFWLLFLPLCCADQPFDTSLPIIYDTREIATGIDGAWSVAAIDVDGDGDIDVVSAAEVGDKVYLHSQDNTTTPISWTTTEIAAGIDGARSVAAIDVDGDGDIDVVSAAFEGDKVYLHSQVSTTTPISWTTTEILLRCIHRRGRLAFSWPLPRWAFLSAST